MLHISCNIGTRDLPDMYALSPRAYGPWALGIHIRQITRAYVTTITYILETGIYVTGFRKTDHNVTFDISRNTDLKY